MITTKTEEYIVIDSHQFDEEVSELIGCKFSGQQVGDMMFNGSYVECEVPDEEECYVYNPDGKSFEDDFPVVEWIDNWIASPSEDEWQIEKTRRGPDYHQMLQYLHIKGHIPEGSYLIKVWW